MFDNLQPNETEIRGEWLVQDQRVVGNEACERIAWLVNSQLEQLASSSGGWDTVFRDPRTGRYWERTYPHSELHGGGPPMLRSIPASVAQLKYGMAVG